MYADSHTAPCLLIPTGDMMRRVLLVDVEPLVLQVMKSTLDRNGFEVDTALTGDVAAQLFSQSRHAVIVLGGDSRELLVDSFCEMMSGLPEEQRPLTLLASDEDNSELVDIGCGDCEKLEMPLSLRYLVARIVGHFGCYQRDSLAA